MSEWAATRQGATLIEASWWGESWERDDLEFVVEFTDIERDEDIALALGRSLYAIWSIQTRLRRDGVEATLRAYVERRRASRVPEAKGWTFVGGDVPPGLERLTLGEARACGARAFARGVYAGGPKSPRTVGFEGCTSRALRDTVVLPPRPKELT